jgi:hypothetical protein
MADFSTIVNATGSSWETAQGYLTALSKVDANDQKAYSKALIDVQLAISVASSTEQKASSAIDKAYQAHGQVASK